MPVVLDVLDFPGVFCRSNIAFTPTHPNHVWVITETTLGTHPNLFGVNTSDRSTLVHDKTIAVGQDLTYGGPNKYIRSSEWITYLDKTGLFYLSGSGDLGIINMNTETASTSKKYIHPDELTLRTTSSFFGSMGLVNASSQFDCLTVVNQNTLARIRSFSTWADSDTYGVTLLTKDSSGPNYLDGVMGVVRSPFNFGSPYFYRFLASSPSGWISHINMESSTPSVHGTPILIGSSEYEVGLNFASRITAKDIAVCGGQYQDLVNDSPSIYFIDTSGVSPVLISTYTNLDVKGFYTAVQPIRGTNYVVALAVDAPFSLVVIDISDMQNPQTVSVLTDEQIASNGSATLSQFCHMVVMDRTVYLRTGYPDSESSNDYLRIVSVGLDDLYPSSGGEAIPKSWAVGLDLTRSSAAVPTPPEPTPRPTSLEVIGSVTHTNLNGAWHLGVKSDYAFVVSVLSGRLTSINISNPANPTYAHSVSTGTAYDVAVKNNYAYVVNSGGNMRVVNITDPNLMTLGNTLAIGQPRRVFAYGNNVYVTRDSADILAVYSITSPASPVFKSSVTDGTLLNGADGLFVEADLSVSPIKRYAYVVATLNDRLTIVDVTSETAPVIVGSIPLTPVVPARPMNVIKKGNYCFLNDDIGANFFVIDVSDPTNPTLAAEYRDTSNLGVQYGLAEHENFVFAGEYGLGKITAIDVIDQLNPTPVWSVTDSSLLDGCYALAQQGNYLYVSAYNSDRLTVVEIVT